MDIILGFFLALFFSILLVPVLMKYAARWRLVDMPDARKSHMGAIPRVGGIGIAVAAAIPALLWVKHDLPLIGYLAGASIIVTFGVLDDRFDLDYRVKFAGQAIAAIIASASNICIYHLPLAGLDPVPDWIGHIVTVLFLLAVTNAFNLLDGLDGLAAGCAILTLTTMGLLASRVSGGADVALIVVAVIGGVLGFLRYNTYPAMVFMGDAGSQFLGFTIGILAILLIEHTQNVWSPAIVLPILGLPLLDTVMVMALRIGQGRSPFSPDRNHIHYRLLTLGLKHHQAVAVIYSVQALMILSAWLLRYEADALVLLVYVAICASCILAYWLVRRRTGGRHEGASVEAHRGIALNDRWQILAGRLRSAAVRYVEWSVAGYLIIGAGIARNVPKDISALALVLALAMIAIPLLAPRFAAATIRVAAYLVAIYLGYLSATSPDFASQYVVEFNLWLTSLGAALAVIVVFSPRDQFQFSTLDLLIVLVLIAAIAIPTPYFDQATLSRVLIRSFVVIYAAEVLISLRQSQLGPVGMASCLSLLALGGHMVLGYWNLAE